MVQEERFSKSKRWSRESRETEVGRVSKSDTKDKRAYKERKRQRCAEGPFEHSSEC